MATDYSAEGSGRSEGLDIEDFESLLDEAMASDEEDQEGIVVKALDFDPLLHIADIFEKEGSTGRDDGGSKYLVRLILDKFPTSEARRFIESHAGEEADVHDLAGIIIAADAAKRLDLPSRFASTDSAGYIRYAGRQAIRRIEEVINSVPLQKRSAVQRPAGREISVREGDVTAAQEGAMPKYREIMFQGYNIGSLVTAGILKPLFEGVEDQLRQAKSKEDLKRIVLANLCRKASGNEGSVMPYNLIGRGEGIDNMLLRIFAEAGSEDGKICSLNVADAVELYGNIVSARKKTVEELTKILEVLSRTNLAKSKRVLGIITDELTKEKGIFLEYRQYGDDSRKDNYARFRKDLLAMEIKSFGIWELDQKDYKKRQRGDTVITVKALEGRNYSDGTSLEDMPLMTIGMLDSDLEFIPLNEEGGSYRLKAEELRKLIRIASLDFEKGDEVTLVRNMGRASGHSRDEYYYGGDISSMPLGNVGKVERLVDPTNIRVEFPRRGWHCHPDELEHTSAGISSEENKKKLDWLRSIMGDMLSRAEEEDERIRKGGKNLVANLVGETKAQGIDPRVISYLFRSGYGGDAEDIIDKRLLPETDIFEELETLLNMVGLKGVKKGIIEGVKRRTGITFFYNQEVESEKDLDNFKEKLLGLSLRGYKISAEKYRRKRSGDKVITVRASKERYYSDSTDVNDLPLGTIGRIDSDGEFVDDKEGDYYSFEAKELALIEEVSFLGYSGGSIRIGDKVVVVKDDGSPFDSTYCKQRNRNFPAGTEGVCDSISGSDFFIRFKKEGEWSRGWTSYGYDGEIPKDIGCYKEEEIKKQMSEREKEKFRKDNEKLIGQISDSIAEVEKRYRESNPTADLDSLSKLCINTLISLGWSGARIRQAFESELSSTRYFEEKGLLPEQNDRE